MDPISHIRLQIQARVGQNVTIRANTGRRREHEYTGLLTGAYPNIFTLCCMLDGTKRSLAYTYEDILTGSVLFVRRAQQDVNLHFVHAFYQKNSPRTGQKML